MEFGTIARIEATDKMIFSSYFAGLLSDAKLMDSKLSTAAVLK